MLCNSRQKLQRKGERTSYWFRLLTKHLWHSRVVKTQLQDPMESECPFTIPKTWKITESNIPHHMAPLEWYSIISTIAIQGHSSNAYIYYKTNKLEKIFNIWKTETLRQLHLATRRKQWSAPRFSATYVPHINSLLTFLY